MKKIITLVLVAMTFVNAGMCPVMGSTDITCYSKNGLSVVKRVNSPKYCN